MLPLLPQQKHAHPIERQLHKQLAAADCFNAQECALQWQQLKSPQPGSKLQSLQCHSAGNVMLHRKSNSVQELELTAKQFIKCTAKKQLSSACTPPWVKS